MPLLYQDMHVLRGRGAGRGTGRGNHREGQIVNNSNVDRRQELRNQVTQLANRQNTIFDIRNNQTARQIVFDSLKLVFKDLKDVTKDFKNVIETIKFDLKIYQMIISNFRIFCLVVLIRLLN